MKNNIITISILLFSGIMLSCQKKDNPIPINLKAVPDTVYINSDSVTFNVIENDINAHQSKIYYPSPLQYWGTVQDAHQNMGTLKKKSDSTFTYIRDSKYAFGTYKFNYTISPKDDIHISSSADVYIKMGTPQQFETQKILNQLGEVELKLFAIDGDTSKNTKDVSGNCEFIYSPLYAQILAEFPDFAIKGNRYVIGRGYIIMNDGSIQDSPEFSNSPLKCKILGLFKSKAITLDKSIIDVSGVSLEFQGKKYDYIAEFRQVYK